jgi:acyl carrier protein
MASAAPFSAATPSRNVEQEQRIRHLPADAQAAFRRFQTSGQAADLDPIIFALIADFMPAESARPLAELPPTTRLIEDLGFDSLAITELVFFAEDLFGITISNQEIMQVRSLDDLRGFICQKVAVRST